LLWQGPPRRLIDLARERAITLCSSTILLAELAEVIARDKFAQRVIAAGLSAAELVDDYRRLAQFVEPTPLSAAISRDPDDDHVLACASAAAADLIVTRDNDLLVLKQYERIPIVAAADALRRLDLA
jgi:putative PIN family toxin of toxin-antitoxin system